MGVMKAVGEAVQEGQSYTWDKMGMTHSLRSIGIAPWGYVERKEALVSKDDYVSTWTMLGIFGLFKTVILAKIRGSSLFMGGGGVKF